MTVDVDRRFLERYRCVRSNRPSYPSGLHDSTNYEDPRQGLHPGIYLFMTSTERCHLKRWPGPPNTGSTITQWTSNSVDVTDGSKGMVIEVLVEGSFDTTRFSNEDFLGFDFVFEDDSGSDPTVWKRISRSFIKVEVSDMTESVLISWTSHVRWHLSLHSFDPPRHKIILNWMFLSVGRIKRLETIWLLSPGTF